MKLCRSLVAAAGATLMLLLPLCAHSQAKPEKPKVSIAVGGKAAFYYLPLTIAERLGYFKDEGLEVEISDFDGGSKALQAVVGGSADVVSGAWENTIDQQPKGLQLQGFVLQGRYPMICVALAKAKAATYKSPKDLKGLKIGVSAPGSSTNRMVLHLLAKDGLKGDDVSIIGVGTSAGVVAAITSGQVDAVSNLDPAIAILENMGAVVLIANTRTAMGTEEVFGSADMPAGALYAPLNFVSGAKICRGKVHLMRAEVQRHGSRASLAAEGDAGAGGRDRAARVSPRQQGRLRVELHEIEGCVLARWDVHRGGRAEYAQVPRGVQPRDQARGHQARADLRQQLRAEGAGEVQEVDLA